MKQHAVSQAPFLKSARGDKKRKAGRDSDNDCPECRGLQPTGHKPSDKTRQRKVEKYPLSTFPKREEQIQKRIRPILSGGLPPIILRISLEDTLLFG